MNQTKVAVKIAVSAFAFAALLTSGMAHAQQDKAKANTIQHSESCVESCVAIVHGDNCNEKCSGKTLTVQEAVWEVAGCLKAKINTNKTCVKTFCLKKAKDITGKLICAKQTCSRFKETKDIACLKWKKPQVKNPGTKK